MESEALWDYVAGSGGGGGKGKGGSEQPNTLRSLSTLMVLWLLSEGEILPFSGDDLLKRVYIEQTPVMNPDGSRNFKGVEAVMTAGVQNEALLKGFSDATRTPVPVNANIRKDVGPTTRFIANREFDLLMLNFQVPILMESEDNKVSGTTVEADIFIIDKSNSIVTKDSNGDPGPYRLSISGKTEAYERQVTFTLNDNGPWRVRIERITDDSKTSTLRNELVWQSYIGLILIPLQYPNSAKLAISASAKEISSSASFGIRAKGLKFEYPSCYDPESRTFSGFFDGTFSEYGYTNNPAWVLRGVVLADRWGAGKNVPDDYLDPYTLYELAKRCDERVSDGKGGKEPRYQINFYLTDARDAGQLLDEIVSVFNGMIAYTGSKLIFGIDEPTPPIYHWTKANTIQKVNAQTGQIERPNFEYAGTAIQARHTVALVGFYDEENFNQLDYEYVPDEEGIAQYGYNEIKFIAFGCTTRSQAHRAGLYRLATELNQTQVLKTWHGPEAQIFRPWQCAYVFDPDQNPNRVGGRLLGATLSELTLDREVEILPSRIYSVICVQAEYEDIVDLSSVATAPHTVRGSGFTQSLKGAGLNRAYVTEVVSSTELRLSANPQLGTGSAVEVTFFLGNISLTRVVTNAPGTTRTLTLAEPLPAIPPKNSAWALTDNTDPAAIYRILSITPKYDDSGQVEEYEVTSVEQSYQKWDKIEQYELTGRETPVIQRRSRSPEIQNTEVRYNNGTLTIAWRPSKNFGSSLGTFAIAPLNWVPPTENYFLSGYLAEYRVNGGNWIALPETTDTQIDLYNMPAGRYQARVSVRDAFGKLLAPTAPVAKQQRISALTYPYGLLFFVI